MQESARILSLRPELFWPRALFCLDFRISTSIPVNEGGRLSGTHGIVEATSGLTFMIRLVLL